MSITLAVVTYATGNCGLPSCLLQGCLEQGWAKSGSTTFLSRLERRAFSLHIRTINLT